MAHPQTPRSPDATQPPPRRRTTPDGKALAAADSASHASRPQVASDRRRLPRRPRLIAVAIFVAVFPVHPGRGVGDRHYVVSERPGAGRTTTGSASATSSSTSAGPQLPAGRDAARDAGRRRRPAGRRSASRRPRRPTAKVNAGTSTCSAQTDDGWNADVDVAGAGARVLVLDAHVGAGNVRVDARRTMRPDVAAGASRRAVTTGWSRGSARASRRPSRSTRPSSGSSSRCWRWRAGRGSSSTSPLWAWTAGRGASWVACSARARRRRVLLGALGLSNRSVVGIALVAGGLALAWRQGGSFHPEAPLSYGGLALAAVGRSCSSPGRHVLRHAARARRRRRRAAPDRRALAVAARARARRRAHRPDPQRGALGDGRAGARLRAADARADPAPRAGAAAGRLARPPPGARAARLALRRPAARRRKRLHRWRALEAAAGDVEELHGVRVELASAGDCPVDAGGRARSCSPRARR